MGLKSPERAIDDRRIDIGENLSDIIFTSEYDPRVFSYLQLIEQIEHPTIEFVLIFARENTPPNDSFTPSLPCVPVAPFSNSIRCDIILCELHAIVNAKLLNAASK